VPSPNTSSTPQAQPDQIRMMLERLERLANDPSTSSVQRRVATESPNEAPGRTGRNALQVIMCENCGRIGMLPSQNAAAVYLCPCGTTVLPATPNQLLSFLFSGRAAANAQAQGAPAGLVNQLPVLKFNKAKMQINSPHTDADDDKISCRVCLCEYEDKEDLKLLPCFHRFHKDCIDEWLQRSSACPLCNNAITNVEHG